MASMVSMASMAYVASMASCLSELESVSDWPCTADISCWCCWCCCWREDISHYYSGIYHISNIIQSQVQLGLCTPKVRMNPTEVTEVHKCVQYEIEQEFIPRPLQSMKWGWDDKNVKPSCLFFTCWLNHIYTVNA